MNEPGEYSGIDKAQLQLPPAGEQQQQDFGDAYLDNTLLSVFADIPELPDCELDPLLHPNSCPIVRGGASEDRSSARRTLKADRERTRRDKLNEQFLELASSLDPDRPKNDKGTILSESIKSFKDLSEEVKRLKREHSSLLEESRRLTQEKNDLREEKASLKNETQQLQSQIQQRLQPSYPWPVSAAAAYPYSLPIQQPLSVPFDSNPQPGPSPSMLAPLPYMHLVPPLGAYHMHSAVQAYNMYSNRSMDDRTHNYLHYPALPHHVRPVSHIERPYAQYPSIAQSNPFTSDRQHPSQPLNLGICFPNTLQPNSRTCQQFEGDTHCSMAASEDKAGANSDYVNTTNETPKETANETVVPVGYVSSLCAEGKLSGRNETFRVIEAGISGSESEIALDAILRPPAA